MCCCGGQQLKLEEFCQTVRVRRQTVAAFLKCHPQLQCASQPALRVQYHGSQGGCCMHSVTSEHWKYAPQKPVLSLVPSLLC